MKQVSGSIKLELAQYREMAAFSQFGSDLDASTQKLLNRGASLLSCSNKDNINSTVEEQILVILQELMVI